MNSLNGSVQMVAAIGLPIGTSLTSMIVDLNPVLEVISMAVGILIAVIFGYNKLIKGYLDRKEQRLNIKDKERSGRLLEESLWPNKKEIMIFGTRSKGKIAQAHKDLQLIFNEAIMDSDVDFGIAETLRSYEDQLKYFLEGKSKLDPRIEEKRKKAKHLKDPAEAVDIYIYVKGEPHLTYDIKHLCFVAGVITATANRLYREGKVEHKLIFGGNWDGDGCIIYDQVFQDIVHFQLQ